MAEIKKPASLRSFSKKEAAVLVVGVIFGIFLLLLGFGQIVGNIRAPFMFQLAAKQQRLSEQLAQTDSAFLQEKDTDKDGLSDFEEAYVYQTSIYLEDSDSDGYNDKEEIEAKSNPLITESTPLSPGQNFSPENLGGQASMDESVSALESALSQAFIQEEEITPAKIREILKESGMSEEVLAKIDDATLTEIYQETLSETNQNNQLSIINEQSLQASEIDKESLKNLTIHQIREFLISGGAEEEILNQIDDKTLKSLFLEAINEME